MHLNNCSLLHRLGPRNYGNESRRQAKVVRTQFVGIRKKRIGSRYSAQCRFTLCGNTAKDKVIPKYVRSSRGRYLDPVVITCIETTFRIFLNCMSYYVLQLCKRLKGRRDMRDTEGFYFNRTIPSLAFNIRKRIINSKVRVHQG
jgi:hypothetical protein